jgi:hypothetical protein
MFMWSSIHVHAMAILHCMCRLHGEDYGCSDSPVEYYLGECSVELVSQNFAEL